MLLQMDTHVSSAVDSSHRVLARARLLNSAMRIPVEITVRSLDLSLLPSRQFHGHISTALLAEIAARSSRLQ